MLEIVPLLPYPEDIRFPYLDQNGVIQVSAERPHDHSPYTAGKVLDDTPLDSHIPFDSFRDSYEPGSRAVGFTISRVGTEYFIPESVAFYGDLAAQLLGALCIERQTAETFIDYYYFDLSEYPLAMSGGGLHPDGETNNANETKALVSNVMPTLYALEGSEGEPEQSSRFDEVDVSKVEPTRLWCPDTREITVHQGLTSHAAPTGPNDPKSIRRLASLIPCKKSISTVELTKIMIDDSYFTYADATRLLVQTPA